MPIKIKLKKTLEEITRYAKETGKKYDVSEEFSSRVTNYHPVEYAFTMITIPKIGINPGTKYNTPAGIYCYPLDDVRYEELMDNNLPFMSRAPYIGLVKLNWNAKWLTFRRYGGRDPFNGNEQEEERVTEFLKKRYNFDISQASETPRHWDHSPNARIFDMTYFCSKIQAETSGTKPTFMWANILRELGYDGVYDEGSGIIHTAEETQLVCLSAQSYEKVGIYETATVRATSPYAIEYGKEKKEKGLKKLKEKMYWKQFASLPESRKIIHKDTNINHLNAMFKNVNFLEGATFTDYVFAFLSNTGGYLLDDDGKQKRLKELPKNIKANNLSIEIETGYKTKFENIKAHNLKLHGETKYVPEGIEYKTLIIQNLNVPMQLPENFEVHGNLKISPYSVKKLPNNIKIHGRLEVEHGTIDYPQSFFPQNFDFTTFTGTLYGKQYYHESKEKIIDILEQNSGPGRQSMFEGKWKKFLETKG